MFFASKKKGLIAVIAVLLIASLACLSSADSDVDSGDKTDFAATSAALKATQDALDAGEAEPTKTTAPTEESPVEATKEEVAQAASGGQIDWNSIKSGDIIYSTDFNGDGGDWEDGWVHFAVPSNNENYSTYVTSGFMFVGVDVQETTVYLIYDPIYTPRDHADVWVGTFANNVGKVRNNNISVICRATDAGWYEFSIASNGLWWIWKYYSGDYDVLAQGGVPNYNKNDTDHEITASCIGDQLTFYYDGIQLKNGRVSDSSFKEGQVGLSVYASNLSGVEVEFDWFEVGAN